MTPKTIQFEGSTFCNANCIFCPRMDMTRPKGTMSDELFHKVIKEGKEMGVHRFMPFLNGEPFIHPKIFEWLDYMKKEGVSVCLYTNAGLLTKEKVDKLVKYSNIEYINCSFNAATKETYDKIVRGPDFEKTKGNIEYLVSKAPFKVRVGMTVIEENVHEKELFRKQWGKRAKFGEFLNWAGYRHDLVEMTGERMPCAQFLTKLTILWDGKVCLCCMDYDGRVIFGDLNRESLREIWERMGAVRKKHKQLDFNLPLCEECNANTRKVKYVYKKNK